MKEKTNFVIDGVDSWFEACILKVNPNPTVVTKIMPFNMVRETDLQRHF